MSLLRAALHCHIAPSRVSEYLKPLESRRCMARLEDKGFSFSPMFLLLFRLSHSYCGLRIFLILKFKEITISDQFNLPRIEIKDQTKIVITKFVADKMVLIERERSKPEIERVTTEEVVFNAIALRKSKFNQEVNRLEREETRSNDKRRFF
ncbi:hypothetical protein F2Q69_00045544 [Brassica cretica]|uniref:Uncharacterized protein n=1 Tax=Brassica cretica TaxID=69181 RepID=A0A8S9NFT4_BRACR|nr:hypothetical protein F2Q69_00045544 [Brassica cretica]